MSAFVIVMAHTSVGFRWRSRRNTAPESSLHRVRYLDTGFDPLFHQRSQKYLSPLPEVKSFECESTGYGERPHRQVRH